MNSETIDWLRQEVHDLLDVSSVGLYEFMSMLNTPDQQMSIDERKAVAWQALDQLLTEPGVELNLMRWPQFGSLGKLTVEELPDDPWTEPDEDGRYIAVDRAE